MVIASDTYRIAKGYRFPYSWLPGANREILPPAFIELTAAFDLIDTSIDIRIYLLPPVALLLPRYIFATPDDNNLYGGLATG